LGREIVLTAVVQRFDTTPDWIASHDGLHSASAG